MHYTVDLHKIAQENNFLSLTKILATKLQSVPYLTIGEFFSSLSTDDLETLKEVCDNEEHPNYEELVLLTQMLSCAEGSTIEAVNEVEYLSILTERMKSLVVYVCLESLHRQEMVELNRHHMSFGDDYKDKPIALPTEKGKRYLEDDTDEE